MIVPPPASAYTVLEPLSGIDSATAANEVDRALAGMTTVVVTVVTPPVVEVVVVLVGPDPLAIRIEVNAPTVAGGVDADPATVVPLG